MDNGDDLCNTQMSKIQKKKVTEEFVHEDLGYISQNLLTKDAGQRNQALRLDLHDCAHYVITYILHYFSFFSPLSAARI